MPNGTLFFACPYTAKVNDSSCNNQNAGMTLTRAESLEHALAGNYSYMFKKPTMRLGGTNTSNPCVNWEGNMVWVDSFGFFHSLAHAFRGQPTQYPLPGCHFPQSKSASRSENTCTANGGHAYSADGENWNGGWWTQPFGTSTFDPNDAQDVQPVDRNIRCPGEGFAKGV